MPKTSGKSKKLCATEIVIYYKEKIILTIANDILPYFNNLGTIVHEVRQNAKIKQWIDGKSYTI